METKPIYQSKTFWFNVLAVIVLVASKFGFSEFHLDQNTADTVLTILSGVLAVGNVGLRAVTKQPVSLTKQE